VKTKNQKSVNELHWGKALNYAEYRKLVEQLLSVNKTTGSNQSDEMLGYTRLNVQRMNKWDKITVINTELESVVKNNNASQNWLILVEAWCGDAAQNLPAINKLAGLNSNIELRILLRDENLEIMDEYLTNGGRSIPKLIIMDQEFDELGTWGPRPEPVQQIYDQFKRDNTFTHDQFSISAHSWYGKDRNKTIQDELLSLLLSFN
jgi:hypothetical protein